eukprot:m.49808 g.49808  ORF g.49808 m.49808 type:complete len:293 (-) comp11518_c0_seq2:33-911(-)
MLATLFLRGTLRDVFLSMGEACMGLGAARLRAGTVRHVRTTCPTSSTRSNPALFSPALAEKSSIMNGSKNLRAPTPEELADVEYLTDFSQLGTISLPKDDMVLLPNFVSAEEAQKLFEEVNPVILRSRYDEHHWDNAITHYREIHRSKWSAQNAYLRERVQELPVLQANKITLSTAVHVLDLAENKGAVLPHVDSVDYVGQVVCGLSLLTPSIMQFKHVKTGAYFRVLLPERSLYIMRGSARFDFTHEVFGGPDLEWKGARMPRTRRLVVLFRDDPPSRSARSVEHRGRVQL